MAVAALLPLACSGEPDLADTGAVGQGMGDDALIVPRGLSVSALPGGNGVLEVIALTLRRGPQNTELYAALRNVGDEPACGAALSVELFDTAEQSLAAGISGLHTQRLHRLTDDPETLAACVEPGDVTMAAVTDLPADIVIEEVGHIVYRCPYFALDVEPIHGLAISQVKRVTGDLGTAYAGTLVNGLDITLGKPSVTVFPVNRVGRPLGVATGSSTVDIPPGSSWVFETSTVEAPGVDQLAYPAGAFGH